jgi:hypothetical protein
MPHFQKFIIGKVRQLSPPPRKSIIRKKLPISAALEIGFQQKAFRFVRTEGFLLAE